MIKAQTPAEGISLNAVYENSATFTVDCGCHDPEHGVNMWIEMHRDDEVECIDVTFYVNATTPWWKKGFSRFQAAWDILAHGYREEQHCLILNKQNAVNMAQTMLDWVAKLEQNKSVDNK